MPTEGSLGCVLRGLVCDYLPCCRGEREVFLGWGTETLFYLTPHEPLSHFGAVQNVNALQR